MPVEVWTVTHEIAATPSLRRGRGRLPGRLPGRLAIAGLILAGLVVPPARGEESASPAESGSLLALTYNVAGLPEALSGSHPATNSPLISPLLNGYDLVLLQENWADPLADERQAGLVPEAVPRLGFHDQVVAEARHPYRSVPAQNPPPPNLDRLPTGPALSADGLNRLSNFPFGPLTRVMWDECNGELAITVVEEVSKTAGTDEVLDDAGLGVVNDSLRGGATDCAAHKGFSVATTELAPGVEVDVYNLHGEAGSAEPDRLASRAGYIQLAEYINRHSAGRAIILGGDTNLHTDVPSDRPDWEWDTQVWSDFLAATGLVDVCGALDCGADAGRIDKFAFRSSVELTFTPTVHRFEVDRFRHEQTGEPLSDHDALAVRFDWDFAPSAP